jgi:predicted DNA-binding antitoxin AbrB/MazE fold protein
MTGMTYEIDAIFDKGVFRPLEPLAIPDGLRVHLHVEGEYGGSESRLSRRAGLDEILRIAAELPVEGPDDGFSGADHDRLLYCKP